MATNFTASAASGYATDVLWYNDGPLLAMRGHYSSPTAATGYIETGMYKVSSWFVEDADPTTYVQSAGANGTIAVYFSGLVEGSTGWFEFKGY